MSFLTNLGTTLAGQSLSERTTGTTTASTTFRPEDEAALRQQQARVGQNIAEFQDLTKRLGAQAAGGVSTLDAIRAPQFSTDLDTMSKNVLARGKQNILGGTAAQQGQIARRFAGQQGVSKALQTRAGIQGALAANPLLADVQRAQAGRELGQQQLILAGQEAANRAKIQQQQLGAAARQEQAGFGRAGLQAEQQLLAALSQLAQQFGQQTQATTGTTQQGQAGLLETGPKALKGPKGFLFGPEAGIFGQLFG